MNAPIFPLLWFSSHTPQVVGQQHCAMARWLGYHAGTHGTGYKRIGQSVPLATGTSVHTGLQLIGEWVLEYQAHHGGARPAESAWSPVVAWAASEAARRYEATARLRGFADPAEQPAIERLILEQRTLIEGLIWVWALVRLPFLLATYRLINVEQEETFVLACTCGLGEGVTDWTTHQARGCTGIVQQGRADWLLEHVESHALTYLEFKTKAQPQAFWETAWDHAAQLLINMEAGSKRLGKPIVEAYVDVLFKGWRGRDKGDPPEVPKYQHSLLCTGYYQPPAPPFREGTWKASYWSTDDQGRRHSLPKTFEKRGIWDDPSVTVEGWVRNALTDEDRAGLIKVLGPFPRQSARLPQAMAAIVVEELDWQARVEQLRALHVYGPADHGTTDPGPDQPPQVDLHVARSWDCTFYDNSSCPFRPICDREPGWEDPLTMGRYQMRTPHHATEQTAVEACGVTFPADEDDDSETEE